MRVPRSTRNSTRPFPPMEVDLVSCTCIYICFATQTLFSFYIAPCPRGRWFPYSRCLSHTCPQGPVSLSRCPCLRGPESLLEDPFCSRDPDYLLMKPIKIPIPSLRRLLPLRSWFPPRGLPHLHGVDFHLQDTYDLEVPFLFQRYLLSFFEAPWVSMTWLRPQNASWGLVSLRRMPFSTEDLIPLPGHFLVLEVPILFSRSLFRSWFPPQDAHCSSRWCLPPRGTLPLMVLFSSSRWTLAQVTSTLLFKVIWAPL